MFSELITQIKNIDVFTDSVKGIIENFSINTAIMLLMMIFTVIAAIDKMRGNKHGYGAKFDEAFGYLGTLALAMVGIITLTPVLKMALQPLITPIYEFFGASPAMFAGTIFPLDGGGYTLAMELAGDDAVMGRFSGVVVGSVFGNLITGLIPVTLSIIHKRDYPYFSAAVLIAVVTMPIGCIAGGLVMNLTPYHIGFAEMLINLIPMLIIAALIVVGLLWKPNEVMNGFVVFGRFMQMLLVVGILLSTVQSVTGLRLPLFSVMVEPGADGNSPLTNALLAIGNIALVLSGALPMMLWITKKYGKSIAKFAGKFGLDEASGAGMVAGLASIFPQLDLIDEMNPKGKLLSLTFAISASFILGDHLGFVAGVDTEMIFPLIVTKLTAGLSALILSNIFSDKLLPKIEKNVQKQLQQELTEVKK